MPTAAYWNCGSTDGNFGKSAVPVGTVSEDVYFRKVLYLSYTQKPGGRLPKRALRSNAINIRLAHLFQPSNQVPFRLLELTCSSALVKSAIPPDAFINVPDALGASLVEARDSL